MTLTNTIILFTVFIGTLFAVSCLAGPAELGLPSPVFTAVLSIAVIVILLVGLWLIGLVFLYYILTAIAALLGPVLLLVGLRMLYVRFYMRIRYRAETEGHIVYYIRNPWNNKINRRHTNLKYYTPWFPVVEYEADGQRFRQKSESAILCDMDEGRPPETTVPLRYDPKHPERFYMPKYTTEFSMLGWIAASFFLLTGGGLTCASVLMVALWMEAV